MKKKSSLFIDRTGEIYYTNQGYRIEIIEYINRSNITIRFDSGLIIKNVNYSNISKGTTSNPYHPSVCGVGYFGVGDYKSVEKNGKRTIFYENWSGMIKRCYDKKSLNKSPTYKNVKVCEEWHNFQNFAKWHENNYKEGFDLDKDILSSDDIIYSPKTCVYIPTAINTLFASLNKKPGKYGVGISRRKENHRYQVHLNDVQIGLFWDLLEAQICYKIAKEEWIKEVANKWKNLIDIRVYNIMMNYKI